MDKVAYVVLRILDAFRSARYIFTINASEEIRYEFQIRGFGFFTALVNPNATDEAKGLLSGHQTPPRTMTAGQKLYLYIDDMVMDGVTIKT